MEALNLTTCTHAELLELDQSHAYTAISNATMMFILSNSTISSAVRLWLLVRFQQSGFQDRETVERPINWFAKQLNVSSSTIQKWQRLLEREGYLQIIEQRQAQNQNRPNRYRATIPKIIQKQLKKKNNRSKVNIKYTEEAANSGVSTSYTDSSSERLEEKRKEDRQEERAEAAETAVNTDQNNAKAGIEGMHTETATPEHPSGIQRLEGKEKEQLVAAVSEQIEPLNSADNRTDTTWLKPALQSYLYEIDTDRKALWITGLNQFGIRTLKSMKDALVSRLSDYGYKIDSIHFNRDCNGHHPTPTTLTTPSGEKPEDPIAHQTHSKGQTSGSAKSDTKNAKVLTHHTVQRIKRRLQSCSISGQPFDQTQSKQLLQELIYALESGSLSQFEQFKGINIGLKLIRENRWRTPAGYPQAGSQIG